MAGFLLAFFLSAPVWAQVAPAPIAGYPDLIHTKGGRKLICRIDAVYTYTIYFTQAPGTIFTDKGLPVDSVRMVDAGSRSSVSMLKGAKTFPFIELDPSEMKASRAAPRVRVQLAVIPGGSMLIGKNAASGTPLGDWLEGTVRTEWQYGFRLAVTGHTGLGGYAWFDTRSSEGTSAAMSGSYEYTNVGAGFIVNKPFAGDIGYYSFNVGIGVGSFDGKLSGNFSGNGTKDNIEASGSGAILDLGGGIHWKLVGPLHIGVEGGLQTGSASGSAKRNGQTVPASNSADTREQLSRARAGICLSLLL